MKQLVITVAMALISQNGKTSTLEVKNECHAQNSNIPGFELTQAEVSQFMNEMYQEAAGEIARNLQNDNGRTFYEYENTPPLTAGIVLVGNPGKGKSSNQITHVGQKNPAAQPADVLGSVDNVGNLTDGDNYVAFEAGQPETAMVFDTKDSYAARAGFKTISSVVHEDIRMMQLKNFLKKYVTA